MLTVVALVTLLSPQDPPQDKEKRVRLWDSLPQVNTDPANPRLDFDVTKEPRDGEFFVAPIPVYNPTVGAGLTLAAGYIFPLGPAGTPPSMVGGGVFYSDSGSWFVGGGAKLHLAEDQWRLTAGGGVGQLNYDFSGIGTTQGDEDAHIPLSVAAGGGQVELLRQIVPTLYGGLRVRFGRVRTDLHAEDEGGPVGSLIPDDERTSASIAISAVFDWDSRDNTFYPSTGTLTKLGLNFHPEEIGDFEYQVYELGLNRYVPVNPDHILALRAYGRLAKGDVPYYGLSYLGLGPDLRGYTIGRYQDRFLVAGQAEWRWRFAERWVAVGFAGVGQVAPDVDELSGDDLLPSLGLGLRFTIAPENKVSLRFDAAAGKDDYAFYFGVAEAF